MGTVSLGTIDLTTLCGCPNPCASCCGVTCGSCSGIPQTLTVSLTTFVGACTSIVSINWDAVNQWWFGDNTCNCTAFCNTSDVFWFKLTCNGGLFTLATSCDNFVHSTSANATTVSCSPFQLVYNGYVSDSNCLNCTSVSMTVTITP